jgi:uncharacterized DUF497 family protein
MRVDSFDWDAHNVDHIARHHVVPDEVEELWESKIYLIRGRSGRYQALGQTVAGRYLICVFERYEEPGWIRVVTARDMNDKERRLFRRKVR